jgi:large subunit ribosomal protein L6
MSRIGKKPLVIPAKTEVTLSGKTLVVKGPLGEISRNVHDDIAVVIENGAVTLSPKNDSLETNALWGTYASHLVNMVEGVTKSFEKKLQLEGIGYKVDVKGDKLVMALGFSHPVEVPIPAGLKVTIEKNIITISGIDKEKVGQFTSRIRDLKKPEPYKGKGLRYQGEVIKIKQGKKSA